MRDEEHRQPEPLAQVGQQVDDLRLDGMWQPDATSASTEPERPRMQLTQELFEAQQALWEQTVEALPAGKP
ncbi:hypothetical protein QMO14_11750, partial [Variovorax sp. CAN2819]|uniref:hypothetical protein n=1 Tax=Variovorax sp. CAN15 TaxID=3046727 RepID=UPI0026471FA6